MYPSIPIQSPCLVSCPMSLILLNEPSAHNSPLRPLLFLPCSPFAHSFPRDLSHYCHSHCSSLGHSPMCQSGWHRAGPPSLCVVTAPCLHRHCGWCQDAPARRSPSSSSLLLSITLPPRDAALWNERFVRVSRKVRGCGENKKTGKPDAAKLQPCQMAVNYASPQKHDVTWFSIQTIS